ncbi:Ribose ABC transporter ATP-binding protein [Vibrio nigripulchritudo SOn1]|uniref:Ribose ABC transporter ATP-binding protein n=1 Tax=Vibrio nigripulchritudo SOn1 TaxID=1238450 RepID=A0AAV2VT68_9VIBR|nr:sugar ABC transporter ATP-binding protein [Vibrio nigripulchritudo]CCO47860.1 Ribose ABC transporter ATP-binding protein [Vibrio nigripulchritudo SOn1]
MSSVVESNAEAPYTTAANTPTLELKGVRKEFPGVVALNDVSFDIRSGEVHALLGENGAGKSTLMKILSGIYQADRGEILIDGKPVKLKKPMDARNQGILMIHQELSLVEDLTVAENIFLGMLPRHKLGFVDRQTLNRRSTEILGKLNCDFYANDKVADLTIAKKYMVEIARALVFTPKIVIFDEPTSSLTDYEKVVLFDMINEMKKSGVGIAYISHRMDEIFTLSDRLTVLRDGEYRGTLETSMTNEQDVTALMIGRELDKSGRVDSNLSGETVLEAVGLSLAPYYQNVSFKLRKGTVVGMYGLVGAGRTEVAETLFGLRQPEAGYVTFNGERKVISDSKIAVDIGIALVPENRKEQGLVLEMSCRDNMTIAQVDRLSVLGWLLQGKEGKIYDDYASQLSIKSPDGSYPVGNLSGGNQQKVVIGKWLSTQPKVLILDEPTRGIDVGSKSEIHALIRELARSGLAVLVISSEMPEVLSVSDQILAMYEGKLVKTFTSEDVTESALVTAITGQ